MKNALTSLVTKVSIISVIKMPSPEWKFLTWFTGSRAGCAHLCSNTCPQHTACGERGDVELTAGICVGTHCGPSGLTRCRVSGWGSEHFRDSLFPPLSAHLQCPCRCHNIVRVAETDLGSDPAPHWQVFGFWQVILISLSLHSFLQNRHNGSS